MNVNDPEARENSDAKPADVQSGPTPPASSAWGASPALEDAAQPEAGELVTPPRGTPLGGEPAYAAPKPWSTHGSQQGTRTYGQPTPRLGDYSAHYPGTGYSAAQQRAAVGFGFGKFFAMLAILLVVAGGAGALGGYLATGTGAISALDAPRPAARTANAPEGSIEAVAQKLSPSVVQLQVASGRGTGEGSGFVLSTDGYVLTNNHVVESAANSGRIQAVFRDGKKAAAKVVGRDPTTDIAVVKLDGVSGLTPVELGRSDDLRVGQGVVAIGSPFQLAGTVTSGIISALNRPVGAGGSNGDQATVMDAVQTDAAINPGNSGGPLANMSGQVIGINSAIYSPRSTGSGSRPSEAGSVGIGFAIPIDQARRTADDIIKTGQAVQTFIGAQVRGTSNGAEIGDIIPGSPAQQAGLKPGDVVTKFEQRPINDPDTLIAAIRTRAPNEKVQLTLGDGRVVEITLGGQPVRLN